MVSLDARLNLAFNLHSAPGVYALLLGSGISRSAGMPTGWEVTLDLISRLAAMMGEEPVDGPVHWYTKTFGRLPGYSEILTRLCATPAERRQALRAYFEPTEEERETGQKVPQVAHRAIARLVRTGYVRVIVTTNFDTLIEQAVQAEGVAPTVISTADGVRGALPLQHEQCVVLKLHGDYRDVRIRNTEDELAAYPAPMRRLLDRILDEYGLIVSGWSGEWDFALRGAFERCASRRFTTYWTSRGEPNEAAQRLIETRRAATVSVVDADEFFSDLASRVEALEALDSPHPLTTGAAVAALKTYIVDERHQIKLTELVTLEAGKVAADVKELFPNWSTSRTYEEYADVVHRVDVMSDTLVHLMAAGCYWSEPSHYELWRGVLSRVVNSAYVPQAQRSHWLVLAKQVSRYPALPLLLVGSIAALARGKFELFARLTTTPTVLDDDERKPASESLSAWEIMDQALEQAIYPHPVSGYRYNWALDLHLFSRLREPLKQVIPDDLEYEDMFVRATYILALQYADYRARSSRDGAVAPLGKWVDTIDRGVVRMILNEIEGQGSSWPPLREGLFTGSSEDILQLAQSLNTFARREAHRR